MPLLSLVDQQTVARPQRVQQIQVLRGASVVRCRNEGRC
jgi:hypothetical protein